MNTIANVSFFIIRKLAMVLLANAVALGIPLAMIAIHITDSTVVKDWFSSSQVYELIIEESVGLV